MSADTPPSPPPGFTGQRHRILAAAQDGPHHVTLAVYRFPPGDGDPPGPIDVPYVELHETHDGARPGRVMALSALVHMAQNASGVEVWAIGGRETPGRPDRGPRVDAPPSPADLRALASCADAVAIPDALARRMAAALLAAADALTDARVTITRLNRRAQQAEAIADRCVPGRPQTGPGLGRALANYAAARLAAIAREAVEGWAAAARCEGACQHGHECAPSAELVARLDALTGGPARATVGAMATLPTLERLGYAYYLRRRAPDAPTWDRLTAAQQSAELSAVRWVCDTALGADGAGVVYAVSPGDPPPTSPSP